MNTAPEDLGARTLLQSLHPRRRRCLQEQTRDLPLTLILLLPPPTLATQVIQGIPLIQVIPPALQPYQYPVPARILRKAGIVCQMQPHMKAMRVLAMDAIRAQALPDTIIAPPLTVFHVHTPTYCTQLMVRLDSRSGHIATLRVMDPIQTSPSQPIIARLRPRSRFGQIRIELTKILFVEPIKTSHKENS